MLVAGGGATNAVCLHRARAAALGGFEFACAIPGTAGGGVWMNAGAYGSDWSAIVIRALVATPDGTGWLTPAELGFSYRHSSIHHGQVVAAVEYQLEPRDESEIRATVRDLVDRRKATQPTTKRTFGSVFKNPPGELGAGAMLEACGLKGHQIGGALISPKHANFIENAGGATTADCLALMAEARRRAREQFGVELEHEVELLGDVDRGVDVSRSRHPVGGRPAGGERNRVATGGRVERGSRPRARTAEAAAPLPRRVSGERLDLSRLVPSGRSLGIAFLIALGALGAWVGARETGVFAVRTVDVGGANPAVATPGSQGPRVDPRDEPAQGRPRPVAADGGGDPDRRERPLRPCLSPHAPGRRRARARRRDRAPGRRLVPRRRERQGDGNGRPPRPPRARPDLGRPQRQARRRRAHRRAICEPPSQPSRRSSARTSRAASAPSRRPPTPSRSASGRASRSASATRSTFLSSSPSRPG